jgi:hypothetical protein
MSRLRIHWSNISEHARHRSYGDASTLRDILYSRAHHDTFFDLIGKDRAYVNVYIAVQKKEAYSNGNVSAYIVGNPVTFVKRSREFFEKFCPNMNFL